MRQIRHQLCACADIVITSPYESDCAQKHLTVRNRMFWSIIIAVLICPLKFEYPTVNSILGPKRTVKKSWRSLVRWEALLYDRVPRRRTPWRGRAATNFGQQAAWPEVMCNMQEVRMVIGWLVFYLSLYYCITHLSTSEREFWPRNVAVPVTNRNHMKHS